MKSLDLNEMWVALGFTVMVVGFVCASSMDYQDALTEELVYADMVCAGSWPDYKGLEPDCGAKP